MLGLSPRRTSLHGPGFIVLPLADARQGSSEAVSAASPVPTEYSTLASGIWLWHLAFLVAWNVFHSQILASHAV